MQQRRFELKAMSCKLGADDWKEQMRGDRSTDASSEIRAWNWQG
jgi:hypothetical protein